MNTVILDQLLPILPPGDDDLIRPSDRIIEMSFSQMAVD